jgi:biotin carboxyl carrier protein
MATLVEVKVPDIGDFKDVPVIEVLVKPGDVIKTENALVTLESDKATMDVPSPVDGVVKEIKVKLGDKVSEGSVLLTVDADAAPAGVAPTAENQGRRAFDGSGCAGGRLWRLRASTRRSMCACPTSETSRDVPVIEVHVKPGDTVKAEDSLVTLESDKATMDVPVASRGQGGRHEGEGRRQGRGRHADPDAVDRCFRRGTRPRRRPRRPARHPSRRRTQPPMPAPRTSNVKCSCWAPVPAATRRRSAPPISA